MRVKSLRMLVSISFLIILFCNIELIPSNSVYSSFVITSHNKAYCSVSSEVQTIIDIFNTKDSCLGLTLFTVFNLTEGLVNQHGSDLLFVDNQGRIVKERSTDTVGFYDPQIINETTVMFQDLWKYEITLWNIETGADYVISLDSPDKAHHDVFYNPMTNTFMTIGREFINATWEVDTLWEFNWTGDVVWEWKLADWVNNYTATQCLTSNHLLASGVFDYSHANSVYWDAETNIIYLNCRNLDNIWAINRTDGTVLWIAGRNGNFTMYDKAGIQKDTLWYHSHSLSPISDEPNRFILFDNNLHNATSSPGNPTTIEGPNFHAGEPPAGSRMIEVIIDPDTWTMNETWSWTGSPEYYSPIWGGANRLSNGNRLGCFGSCQFREGNYSGPFPEGGAVLIETNDTGTVWQLTLPKGYSIYRARRFQPYLSLNSPEDVMFNESLSQTISWTGTSIFKSHYQISNRTHLLVNSTWETATVNYVLPPSLMVGTHEYTLTVFDLAGQSKSDTVIVTVNPATSSSIPIPGYEILVPVTGFLLIGLVIVSRRKKKLAETSQS
ncbi:MAG: aryl-sulfate sulfotransferase [Candidatus Hodarchaeota archaeon]